MVSTGLPVVVVVVSSTNARVVVVGVGVALAAEVAESAAVVVVVVVVCAAGYVVNVAEEDGGAAEGHLSLLVHTWLYVLFLWHEAQGVNPSGHEQRVHVLLSGEVLRPVHGADMYSMGEDLHCWHGRHSSAPWKLVEPLQPCFWGCQCSIVNMV